MTTYFNLHDSRHYGWQLNQIGWNVYQQFLLGEDEDVLDMNVVALDLDSQTPYWVLIPEDYNYFSDDGVQLSQSPISGQGLIFKLTPDGSHWISELI